jgi:hypothetical protein
MNGSGQELMMDARAWISLCAAIVSVVACIWSFISAHRSRAIAIGQTETSVRASIRMTRLAVREIALKLEELIDGRRDNQLNAQERRRVKSRAVAFNEAVEENLNAYEDACGKYIDNKIDKKRFKKSFVSEIQNLCEAKAGEIFEFLHPEANTKFRAIWKVYREWHIHES